MVHIAGTADTIVPLKDTERAVSASCPGRALLLTHARGHVVAKLQPEQVQQLQEFLQQHDVLPGGTVR